MPAAYRYAISTTSFTFPLPALSNRCLINSSTVSAEVPPAGDADGLAADVRGVVAGEERDDGGHLIGLAEALQRRANPLGLVLRGMLPGERSEDDPGRDPVASHAMGAELGSQRPGHRAERRLGRTVGT